MAIWRRKPPGPDPGVEEARLRLEEAQQDLAAARGDDDRVAAVAHQIQEIRRANRFADLMRRALLEG